MAVRAVRGAVSVGRNEERQILDRTREMVLAALEQNSIEAEDIVSIVFCMTHDLDRAFAARAAREIGLTDVPLLDTVSPAVTGSMPRVVRMLLSHNTDKTQSQIKHVYLGEAAALRPDLAQNTRPESVDAESGCPE